MEYVYGPVPSRRLGQSLGIDPIPLKTCNWNCVYCQLGRTVPLTNQRKAYQPAEAILTEVEQALGDRNPEDIDWITFVGSGEPTLHSELGGMIRKVQELTEIPVAVITNGALCWLPEVREDLRAADALLPSLDVGSAELYRKVNRPHPEIPYQRYHQGLVDLRRDYSGKLWVEVMLVRDLNDTPDALKDLAQALEPIQPDLVHLSQPTRPPVETWVQPPTPEGLLRAQAILGEVSRVLHPAEGSFDLSSSSSPTEAVLGIINRHPLREDQLHHTLETWSREDITQALQELRESGRCRQIERCGVEFWVSADSHYPEQSQSQRTEPGRDPDPA